VKTVPVSLGERSYTIYIETGLLDRAGEIVTASCRARRGAIITNPRIAVLYEARLRRALNSAGFEVGEAILIPPGEKYKSLQTIFHIERELARRKLDRQSAVIVLGGGIAGDVAGFVAATYLRGIELVQVPTTLVAQVDSSIGGKTGVNLPEGKNLVGAFYQPRCVLIDPETLITLPHREVRAGIAEIIKYGVIADAGLFEYLQAHQPKLHKVDENIFSYLIERSCQIKADVVSRDETESDLRAILNFGHTIGHALEAATGYRHFLHGEAVAVGMVAASRIAERMGLAEQEVSAPIHDLLERFDLPTTLPRDISYPEMMEAMCRDKKIKGGKLRFVLPVCIGGVILRDDVSPETVQAVLEEMRE